MLEQGEGTVLNVYLFLDQGSKCMEGIVKDLAVESLPGDRQCPGASLSGCHRCRGCLTGSGSFEEGRTCLTSPCVEAVEL